MNDGKPFFMNFAQFAVHTKIAAAPEKYLTYYQDGRPKTERDYGSMITAMDASLGSILKRLNDPNGDGNQNDSISKNTLIIFLSDNGGLSNHTRTTKSKFTLKNGSKVSYQRDYHNSPSKSGKGSGYDGGMRIPMMIAWADQHVEKVKYIESNSVCDEPVHGDDIFPTILSITGVQNPTPEKRQDGEDLTPLLFRKTFHREKGLYWHYPHQWYKDVGVGLGIEPFSAVRVGKWKYLYFYGDGVKDNKGHDPREELYDMSLDVGEQNNLIQSMPEKANEMKENLFGWLKSVKAGLPVVKKTGKASFE